jgi:hypothetical protein
MGTEDRTRARAAIDAVSDKHRALSAMVGAAATWAAAVSSRTQRAADDIAWRRTTADITGDASAGAWGSELRDYQPLVVWPEYAERLTELHDDLGTALLGPAAYKSVAGLAPANSLHTVKHSIESAWREDRASQTFEGYLPEVVGIYDQMCLRHHDWVGKVRCAADVLDQTGFTSLWMRSAYVSSVRDRLDRAMQVYRDVYAALARSEYEPLVVMESNRRDVHMENAALGSSGLRDQDDVRVAVISRTASIIDEWVGALMVGGVGDSERERTVRALDDRYPDAMTAWRGICAARVSNRHPALYLPPSFYQRWSARKAS